MESCSTRWPRPTAKGRRLLQMLTPRAVELLVRGADGESTRLEAAALAARTGLLDRAGPLPHTPRTTEDTTGGHP
ncbi:hypothetical protein OG289_21330 [Streptomyces sp. NBC_01235]|nr:hypothetical protein OG289_21330 [Streptomyces sp. NBC_01235]